MPKILTAILCASVLLANIDQDIEQIMNSPVEDRYKLMNEIKRKIVKMKQQKRAEAIERLKVIFNSKDQNLSQNPNISKEQQIEDVIKDDIDNIVDEKSENEK